MAEAAIREAIAAIQAYLAPHQGPGLDEVRSGIAHWAQGPCAAVSPRPPRCAGLPEALAAMTGADRLRDAIRTVSPLLDWMPYDAYPLAEIGPRFAEAHAFASLVGDGAPIAAHDFDMGLFLIEPHVLYRDRHHAAPELYVPLTGPHRWRFGIDDPWQEKPAHEPVWNPPHKVHATITGDVPFLCVFCWTQDVHHPAKVVFADDWAVLEGRS